MEVIEATEVPVIGALHGQVLGMGLELALSFDLRVAREDCQLAIPEVPPWPRRRRRRDYAFEPAGGPSRAKDMLLTARSIGASEALGVGSGESSRAERADAIERAMALAEQVAKNAPLAVGLAKLIVDKGDGLDKRTQMAIEHWAQSQLITTADVQEAVMAFLGKRPAKFQGR